MATQIRCGRCHDLQEVAPEALVAGLACRTCGSALPEDAPTLRLGRQDACRRLGRFELIGVVGVGAFGTVFKARDVELDRLVAVKVPRAGALAAGEDLDRFLREARSVGQLRHPGIVPVFEIGQDDGLHYLVSEFVHGVTLDDHLAGGPPSPEEAARLSAAVADALHYAHERGVIHRDVKPSNIMIGEDGAPRLMDFGLARRDQSESTVTFPGQVLGTPAYMSPEQARGDAHDVDGRADLYSLGVVLYQMLTGELPFAGTPRMLIYQVLNEEPRSLRSLNDRVPRDLETICLKCLHKDAARRYQTARELADDLRRWLGGEPIRARPVSRLERAWRRVRRRPALSAALTLAAAAVAAVAVVSTLLALSNHRHAVELGVAFHLSEDNRLRAERRLAESYLDRGLGLCEQGEAGRGLLWLARALAVAPAHSDDLQRVARANLAAWAGRLCQVHAVHEQAEPVAALALAPDGATALEVSAAGAARLWDTATGKDLAEPFRHAGPARAAFSGDGRTAISVDSGGAARLWQVAVGRGIALPALARGSRCVALSPRGQFIATGGEDGSVRLFSLDGSPVGESLAHAAAVIGVDFDPTGTLLAARSGNDVRLWRVPAGTPVATLRHKGLVRSLAFRRDGQMLLTGSEDSTARLWRSSDGEALTPPLPHQSGVRAVAFRPDGQVLLTASRDFTARQWDAAKGKPVGPPMRHLSGLRAAVYSPDGRLICTGGLDNVVRLWNPATGAPAGPPLAHARPVSALALSADGRTLTGHSEDRQRVQVWKLSVQRPLRADLPHRYPVRWMMMSRSGDVLATDSSLEVPAVGQSKLWRLPAGEPIGPTLEHAPRSSTLALSPDGRTLLTETGKETAQLWQVGANQPLGPPLRGHVQVIRALFAPNGALCATSSAGGTVRLWRVPGGEPLGRPMPHPRGIWALAFSPDGKVLATGGRNGRVRLWDVESGERTGPTLEHGAEVLALAFAPDGRALAAGGKGQAARLYDVRTGRALTPPLPHQGWVGTLAFRADGQVLLTGSVDRTARLWDAATGKPISPPLEHPEQVMAAAFAGEGRVYTAWGSVSAPRAQVLEWQVPAPRDATVAEVLRWAERVTGLAMDEAGTVRVLDGREWRRRTE